jgi:malonyl-ACP decarboxylase
MKRIVVTGMGVRTAIAGSVPDFEAALRDGRSGVAWTASGVGRVAAALLPADEAGVPEAFAAAARRVLRSAPLATRVGCAVALEAMLAANLTAAADLKRSAILVAGNNIHQRYMQEHYDRFRERPEHVNPRYAVSFLDTHVVAALSELAGLGGPGFTVGGSMASGNVALYQAFYLLQAAAAPACICVGALADFGELELRAFANLGALAVATDESLRPGAPFDRRHAGFAYGQGSACVILETEEHAAERGAAALAEVAGVALLLDGHAASDPSAAGEAAAMREALDGAGVLPAAVDYLNAHGTGTPAGDEAECEAIAGVFAGGAGPWINSTKALTGHTLYAAGIVEAVATVIQMRGGFVHGNPLLSDPIAPALRFAGTVAQETKIELALSNAFSVGGINSSVVFRRAA